MFKRIKQDKKVKTFKKINAKDLRLGVNNLDGKYLEENNYAAVLFNTPIPKPKIPKFEKMFGDKPFPKKKVVKKKFM